jgi:hypothetical protein
MRVPCSRARRCCRPLTRHPGGVRANALSPHGRIVIDAQGMGNLAAYSRFAALAIAARVASQARAPPRPRRLSVPFFVDRSEQDPLLSTHSVVLACRKAIAGNLERPASGCAPRDGLAVKQSERVPKPWQWANCASPDPLRRRRRWRPAHRQSRRRKSNPPWRAESRRSGGHACVCRTRSAS